MDNNATQGKLYWWPERHLDQAVFDPKDYHMVRLTEAVVQDSPRLTKNNNMEQQQDPVWLQQS